MKKKAVKKKFWGKLKGNEKIQMSVDNQGYHLILNRKGKVSVLSFPGKISLLKHLELEKIEIDNLYDSDEFEILDDDYGVIIKGGEVVKPYPSQKIIYDI